MLKYALAAILLSLPSAALARGIVGGGNFVDTNSPVLSPEDIAAITGTLPPTPPPPLAK